MDTNPFTADNPGACISCGFLSLIHTNVSGRPKREFPASQRSRGVVSDSQIIWCFRRRALLRSEVANVPTVDRATAVRRVLRRRRRNCVEDGSWFEWVEEFTPKEHYEMWQMMELEKLRQAQAEMTMKVMEDHKEITRTLANIVKEQTALSDRSERTNTRFNLLFVAIALIAILIGLTPLIYPNGVQWAVDHAPGGASNQITAEATPTP